MMKLVLLISVIVLFVGCVGLDKSVQEQTTSMPTLPVQPTSTAVLPVKTSTDSPLAEENISKKRYLFFEVYLLPPENLGDNVTREKSCGLWASFIDFPTYYFNESERHLYPGVVPPGAYDFIEFNESLIAIAGVGIIGYNSGSSSQLEPIYRLPYSSIGKRVTVPNYWTYIDEFGNVQIINITESGLLFVNFDNQTIKLSPGNSWNKQFRPPCSERIRIVNHGFITGGLGIGSQNS